jgi:xanthine dehydrogenase YagR molybdenum-binding subunit
MDELAAALKMDPIALRLANHADVQPENGKPWSSKYLRECYQMGAEKFGWSKRSPEPRSMKHSDGRLIGWGMSTATYPGYQFPGTARIRLMSDSDGGGVRAIGSSATHDLGTGAYTVFTQITASLVGLPLEKVKFELGDSTLPPAPVAGGSTSTASVGQALSVAADSLKAALLKLATDNNASSTLAGLKISDVTMRDGRLIAAADSSRGESLASLVARANRAYVEGGSPAPGEPPQARHAATDNAEGEDYAANQKKYAFQSFGAHFVEVMIDEPIGRCRVTRVVSVMDIGRVINPKTARSQVMGGVTMGIGMALMEETEYDQRSGKPVTNNLADYAVCVNADIGSIEPFFIDKPDPHMNALGCRGVGEIGITGVAAAVANAVYHATGKRIRDLPITTDKLL